MANSDKRIIYTDDEGNCAIIIPTDNCALTVEEIQAKDVPSGKTSYIVDKFELLCAALFSVSVVPSE